MASNFQMWQEAGKRGLYRRNPSDDSRQPDEKQRKRLDFMRWCQTHREKYLGGQDDGGEEYPEYGPQM